MGEFFYHVNGYSSSLHESNVLFFCPCSVRILRPENNPFYNWGYNSGLQRLAKDVAQSTVPFAEAILNTVDVPGHFVDVRRRMAVVRDVAEGPETSAGQRLASEFDGKERLMVKNVRIVRSTCMQ